MNFLFPLAQKDWPVRRSRQFGATRASGERRHAGVDLTAKAGDIVYAIDSGTLIASQRFNGPEAYALLEQTDSGPVALYGEVFPNSWRDFGLDIGSRVKRGQPIARVGINPGGSQMLHFELYSEGTRRNKRWYANRSQPQGLIDPAEFLGSAPVPGGMIQPPRSKSDSIGRGLAIGAAVIGGTAAAVAISRRKK